MALIELNSDWTKREFGVFSLARETWRMLTEAERREAIAIKVEKYEERRKNDAA